MPSPALMTDAFTFFARSAAAPLMGCRIIIISVPIISSVLPVSIKVSPLATLEAEALIFALAAPRYLLASSKLMRVRVLFS